MNSLSIKLRHVVYILTALFAGILLFVAIVAVDLDKSLMSPGYHKGLLVKSDVYSKVQTVINVSLNDYVTYLKTNSPKDYEQNKNVFTAIEKAFTLEMVRTNLDSIIDGIFQYLKGDRKLLPDIFLSPPPKVFNQINPSVDIKSSSVGLSLEKIDKINLCAVLLYFNRSDITDFLQELKLCYYIISTIPGIFLLLFLLFTLIGIVFCRNLTDIIRWTRLSLITFGALCLVTSSCLLLYIYTFMPVGIRPIILSLPLQSDILISYVKDCFIRFIIPLIILGLLSVLSSLILFYLPKLQVSSLTTEHNNLTYPKEKYQIIFRNSVYIFLCILILAFAGQKINNFKKDFEINNYSSILSKMKNTTTITQVISAKNETIYNLQIRLNDGKKGIPIPNTQINISGKSDLLKKTYNETVTTDNFGIAKFTLDKGTFRFSFIPYYFPINYRLPSPFFFDIKASGTTIITVNIDTPPENEKQKKGVLEIEVLDNYNKPVEGIGLAIDSKIATPEKPANTYSYTNIEGIAAFKVTEGDYITSFIESKFPKQYALPSPFDSTIKPDSTTRYTIRLSDIKVNGSGTKNNPVKLKPQTKK